MIWDADKFTSLDLETDLIETGRLAPEIVCCSVASPDRGGDLYVGDAAAVGVGRALLESDRIIVLANGAFDFGCLCAADPALLPLVFRAYERGRVFDVQIAQALHAIAEGNLFLEPETDERLEGRYSLDTCTRLVLGREDAKANDQWRKRYALLKNVPVADWPEEAKQYPVDDSVNALEIAIAQVRGGGAGVTPGPHRNLGDLSNQTETAWAMHLGALWGLRTDSERVRELRMRTERDHGAFVERFRAFGFFRESGTEDQVMVKRAVIRAYGDRGPCSVCVGGKTLSEKTGKAINCTSCSGTGMNTEAAPRTETGGVSTSRDTLAESGDENLAAYGDNEAGTTLTKYLPRLESEEIGRWLKPNVLVATGRTSYDGVIQQMPKIGSERACHQARPGSVFCDVDYAALELCTWAQIKVWLFGSDIMADTINASGDPGILHTALAASMRGWTTEQMVAALKNPETKTEAKKYRDAAKPANFGFPGGMGSAKLVLTNRKKSAGKTVAPDGTVYAGVRFCLLLSEAEKCGLKKVTEWNDRSTPPTCLACIQIVEEQIRPAWREQWRPKPYFDWVKSRTSTTGELPCFATERVRGRLEFTDGANNGFQALAADGAKHALRKLTRECYLDHDSSLWGTRPIFFVHDEILAEMSEDRAYLAGPRMAEVMVGAMRTYTPDVTIKAEPALMRRWLKVAEPHYVDGRLVPWDDYNEVG